MFCYKCGKALNDQGRFCTQCGAPKAEASEPREKCLPQPAASTAPTNKKPISIGKRALIASGALFVLCLMMAGFSLAGRPAARPTTVSTAKPASAAPAVKTEASCLIDKVNPGMIIEDVRSTLGDLTMDYRGERQDSEIYYVNGGAACKAWIDFDHHNEVTSVSYDTGSNTSSPKDKIATIEQLERDYTPQQKAEAQKSRDDVQTVLNSIKTGTPLPQESITKLQQPAPQAKEPAATEPQMVPPANLQAVDSNDRRVPIELIFECKRSTAKYCQESQVETDNGIYQAMKMRNNFRLANDNDDLAVVVTLKLYGPLVDVNLGGIHNGKVVEFHACPTCGYLHDDQYNFDEKILVNGAERGLFTQDLLTPVQAGGDILNHVNTMLAQMR